MNDSRSAHRTMAGLLMIVAVIVAACSAAGGAAPSTTDDAGATETTVAPVQYPMCWPLCAAAAAAEPAAPSASELGEAMVGALDSYDSDSAVALLVSNPSIAVFSVSTLEEFRSLFAWLEVADWRFTGNGCREAGTSEVRCSVLQSNAWSKAVGADPVAGELRLSVSGGSVTGLEYEFDLTTWSPEVFEPFLAFVMDVNPDDVSDMWNVTDQGLAGPKLSSEALALFEERTGAYVASREAEE